MSISVSPSVSKTVLVAVYKARRLQAWSLCDKWRSETLLTKLVADGWQPPGTIAETVRQSDIDEWDVIQSIIGAMHEGERAPMNCGLALIPNNMLGSSNVFFARDREARWVSLRYVPKGYWRDGGVNRELYLAETRYTKFRYNLPVVAGESRTAYDLTVRPTDDPQLLRVINGLFWAVLSTGFTCRNRWQPYLQSFLTLLQSDGDAGLTPRRKLRAFEAAYVDTHGRTPSTEEKMSNLLIFGGNVSCSVKVLREQTWMPQPYLAFAGNLRARLYDICTTQELCSVGVVQVVPYEIVNGFCNELVDSRLDITAPFEGVYVGTRGVIERGLTFAEHQFHTSAGERALWTSRQALFNLTPGQKVRVGTRCGSEPIDVPAYFTKLGKADRGRALRKAVEPLRLRTLMAQWFARQCYEIVPGFVHVSALLAGNAAKDSVPSELVWRVDCCQEFWEDGSESYVFPTFHEWPIGACKWDVKTDNIEVVVDLTLTDDRYMPKPCYWFGARTKPAPILDKESIKEYVQASCALAEEAREEYRDKLWRARERAAKQAQETKP